MNLCTLMLAVFCITLALVDAMLPMRKIAGHLRSKQPEQPAFVLAQRTLEAFIDSSLLTRAAGFKRFNQFWAAYKQTILPKRLEDIVKTRLDNVDLLITTVEELDSLHKTGLRARKRQKKWAGEIDKFLAQVVTWRQSFFDRIQKLFLDIVPAIPQISTDIPERYFDPNGAFTVANSFIFQEMKLTQVACIFAFGNKDCRGTKDAKLVLPDDFIQHVETNMAMLEEFEGVVVSWLEMLEGVVKMPRADPKKYYSRSIPFVVEMRDRIKSMLKHLTIAKSVEPLVKESTLQKTFRVLTGGILG